MKKLITLVLSLLVVCCLSIPAWAGVYQGYPTVNLTVNGNTVNPDVPAILVSGRTLIPLRMVSESLNAKVTYDSSTRFVTINTSGSNVIADTPPAVSGTYQGFPQVGLLVNGKVLTSDVPPILINGRTMVPVRLVAQALGANVDFKNNTVIISSGTSPAASGNTVTTTQSDPLDPSLFQEDSTPTEQMSSDTSDQTQADIDSILNDTGNDSNYLNDLNNQ